jgi:hypothetical protein
MRGAWFAMLAAGCGFTSGSPFGATTPPDGTPRGDAPADVAVDAQPLGAWGTPQPVFSTATGGDDDPSLTGDMLELYFNRNADIYVATRAAVNQPWGTPTLVAELSSTSSETTPEITYDGLTIYVGSDRPGTAGQDDIWVSTRATRSDTWSAPVRVAELSTSSEDAASAPAPGDLTIVWTSSVTGDYEIYRATRSSKTATWSTPQAVTEVNSTAADYSPMLSADQLTIYLDSVRNAGNDDLYYATRATTSDAFGTPQPINELNTTAGAESDPWISPDSRHLYFTRDGVLYESTR